MTVLHLGTRLISIMVQVGPVPYLSDTLFCSFHANCKIKKESEGTKSTSKNMIIDRVMLRLSFNFGMQLTKSYFSGLLLAGPGRQECAASIPCFQLPVDHSG
jgi:hypothetical protein